MKESNLNYREYGTGDPVIILHGLFGMLDNWHSFARKLSENFRVFAVDQRNHGKSFHSDEFDYDILAEDVSEFMADMGLPQAHFIGHSMGGKTVMKFMDLFRDKVMKSIIVDMAPRSYKGSHHQTFNTMMTLDLEKISSRTEAFEVLKSKINDDAVVHFLLKNLTRDKKNNFRWKANLDSLWKNYDKIISEIRPYPPFTNHTLFVRGSNSDYISKEDEFIISNYFPNSQIATIDGAGHWVHSEKPIELLQLTEAFLADF
ncbi:MAG: alpha/beta fold hydrolase [Saprospiraceae bacterium]|nr:alpha/beta fold hydrolase [Saprospiraceae bacterium]